MEKFKAGSEKIISRKGLRPARYVIKIPLAMPPVINF